MSNRSVKIHRFINKGNNAQVIDVKVSFNPGGINYATMRQEAKGYYLHVQPMEVEYGEGVTMESFMAFSGMKKLIESAERFNQKKLDSFRSLDQSAYNDVLEAVCNNQGLNIQEYA